MNINELFPFFIGMFFVSGTKKANDDTINKKIAVITLHINFYITFVFRCYNLLQKCELLVNNVEITPACS